MINRAVDRPFYGVATFAAAKRVVAIIAIALSAVFAVTMVANAGRAFQFDFKGDLYGAGRAIAQGKTPYHFQTLEAEAAIVRAGGTFRPLASPRWPPPILIAAVPVSVLPLQAAGVLFALVSAAGVILALRLLGVRDWRCLGVVAVSWPVVWGVWLGNVSPLLLLGAALVWHYRERARPLALAVASVIVAKLILWPLAVWLLVTRRFRSFFLTGLFLVGGVFLAWAVIGFAGLAGFPHMLETVAYIGEMRGSSLVTFLLSAGLSVTAARVLALGCAALLLYAVWRLSRRPGGEQRAFGLCFMAALTATPIVWAHYLVLLFVPIALLSPRLSALWFLPMLAVLNPTPQPHPDIWANVPDLAIELVIIMQLCSPLLHQVVAVRGRFLEQVLKAKRTSLLTATNARVTGSPS